MAREKVDNYVGVLSDFLGHKFEIFCCSNRVRALILFQSRFDFGRIGIHRTSAAPTFLLTECSEVGVW